jgi:hypothetical protein
MTIQIDSAGSHPSINADLALPTISIDNNAITLSPTELPQQRIDWDREVALGAESSMSQAAKERNYLDLSSLTREQLDWIKKNYLEPMPGFQWNQSSRREMLWHGFIKLNDYCVLNVVIPFCRFGGKLQYCGDRFKRMGDPRAPDP